MFTEEDEMRCLRVKIPLRSVGSEETEGSNGSRTV